MSPDANRWNSARHVYICRTAGPYFIGVSAGIPAGVQTSVRVSQFGFGVGELMRMTSTTNAMTTLAGKFLIQCDRNSQVTVDLSIGQVYPGPTTTNERSLLSFTAFHYSISHGQSTAWSVYRNSNWTTSVSGMNPFTFDVSDLSIGSVSWSSSTYEVSISVAGNYYVYVSGGTQPNSRLGLTLQRNGNALFGVYRAATNWDGVDTLGHGAVVSLNAGDRLKVVAEPNTAGYSGSERRHASFFGFLII